VELIIFTDGCSKGNPGPAAIGVVINTPHGEPVSRISRQLENTTNNQAEYRAVIAALEEASRLGASDVHLNSDSELVVRQLTGKYKVKDELLKPLYRQVLSLIPRFHGVNIRHVLREYNSEADALANQALKKPH